MPDLTFKAADIWVAMMGRQVDGNGPLNTLTTREGMPNIASYVLMKIRRKALVEMEVLDAAREKLCQELAEKNEDGTPKKSESGQYQIADWPTFGARFNALLQQDVTLTGVRKLRPTEFGAASVTVEELELLGPFLDDDTDLAA